MRFFEKTLKPVLLFILIAALILPVFGCGKQSGSTDPENPPPYVNPGDPDDPGDPVDPGDPSNTDGTEVFNPNDYITYTCPIEDDGIDWYEIPGYDIIIQGGQSNAEGNGYGSTDKTQPFVPRDDILYFVDKTHDNDFNNLSSQKFRVRRAEERETTVGKRNDFSLAFAREYYTNFLPAGRKILIVRAAIGGTGFSENHPNNPNWNWKPTGDLYPRMINAVQEALELDFGDSTDYRHRVVAFLWHQGENDALARMAEDVYYAYLRNLLNNVRTTLNLPKLPFICGDFVHDWEFGEVGTANACAKILAATKRVCQGAAPAAFVPTAGLKSNRQDPTHPMSARDIVIDNIHFCREAVNLLGKKYFDAYKALIFAGYED